MGGESTSGIRIRNKLSFKWSTKAAREQKRGSYAGSKKYAYGGESTPGIRLRNRLSSKLTTKAAREQKRGPCAG
jgi:hypothetical protein